ncbi:MAG: hypothetical protein Q8P25_00555 [Candidatus Curtissbacteria bacterium]|nr:hypothetical protein [Candidatus Curtissbacteria bacterium]
MKQATILRKMSGLQRLEQALSLSDFIRELAAQNILYQNYGRKLSQKDLLTKLRARLSST